jgi:diguanylate cyclase (GGDEF)-like protein
LRTRSSMRLITRQDSSLAVGMIIGTVMVFQQPLRWLFDIANEVEARYHIDLLPALTVLTVVYVFQQYHKRQRAKAQAMASAAETAKARARSEELERLMTLSQTLADALDREALQQALWRVLPAFIAERDCSVLTREEGRWELLLGDKRASRFHSIEFLERVATRAVAQHAGEETHGHGVSVDNAICYTMTAGGAVTGVIVVGNMPPLTPPERVAMGAAAALIAVATRNAQMLHVARQSGARDHLTGCFTRAHGMELLQRELQRARRSGQPLSVLMFDVDCFKSINDRAGHLHGDTVLATVGTQLQEVLRSTDVRCRYGGDEFLVILPETPVLGAAQVAEYLRREIAQANQESGVTISLGVAAATAGEMDTRALIGRADEALYRAKRGGRNRYCLATPGFVPEMTAAAS